MQIIERVKLKNNHGETQDGKYTFELTFNDTERIITMKTTDNAMYWRQAISELINPRRTYFTRLDNVKGLIEITW